MELRALLFNSVMHHWSYGRGHIIHVVLTELTVVVVAAAATFVSKWPIFGVTRGYVIFQEGLLEAMCKFCL